MKKIFFVLSLLSVLWASAQEPTGPYEPFDYKYYRFKNYMEVVKGMLFPDRDTTWTPKAPAITFWQGKWYGYNTTASQWAALSSTAYLPDGILVPISISYTGSGFTFAASEGIYKINDVIYVFDSTTFTLDPSDPTFDRFDVPYVTTDGQLHVLKGTPSEAAAIPNVDADQIPLTAIKVPVLATTPQLSQVYIYDENIEWTESHTSVTVDPDDTENPYIGSKATEVTTINHGDIIYLTKPTGTVDLKDVSAITWAVKLKSVMPSDANLSITFFSNSIQATNELNLPINKNSTAWQIVSVPKELFTIGNLLVDRVRLRYRRPSNTSPQFAGFWYDYVHLVSDLPQPGGGNNVSIQMPPAFNVVDNNDQFQITGAGTAQQYITGVGNLATYDALNVIGTVNSQSKSTNGATINSNQLVLQDVDDDYRGLMTTVQKKTLDTLNALEVQNLGDGAEIAVEVDAFTTGFKSLKEGTGVTLDVTDSTIVINSSGATYSASNGLTMSSNNVKLGGSLSENTLITSNTYLTTWTSSQPSTAAYAITIGNSTGGGTLGVSNSGVGAALAGSTTSGTGVLGIATTGFAFNGTATTGLAYRGRVAPATTNSTATTLRLIRGSTGTPATNMGNAIDLYLQSTTSDDRLGNQIISKWTDATDPTRTSELDITGVNSATTETFMNIQLGGIVRVNNNADTLATRAYARSVGGGGGGTFTSLTDGPGSFSGQSLKSVRVNSGETALEYFTSPWTISGTTVAPTNSGDNVVIGTAPGTIKKFNLTGDAFFEGVMYTTSNRRALEINSGLQNVDIGGRSGNASRTGQENTSVGEFAGSGITSGANNTNLGKAAGAATTTGNKNISIGRNVHASGTLSGDNNIALNADVTDMTASNQMNIGGWFYGKDGRFGVGVSNPLAVIVAGAVSGYANLRLIQTSTPTTINDGNLWHDNDNNLYVRLNGVTKKLNDQSGTTPGIDDVLAIGQSLSTNRAVNLNSNYIAFNSGNVLIGGTSTATSASSALHIFNGTAPTAAVTDGVVFYSKDESSSAEAWVMDEAGNNTVLSPHNFSLIPGGRSEKMAWSFYSERNGTAINVDMLKLARLVEQLSGEQLVYIIEKAKK